MNLKKPKDSLFFHLTQPLLCLVVLLTYSIGVGLSHYLGKPVNWINVFLAGFLGIFLILMRNFLMAYFDHPTAPTCKLHSEDLRYQELKTIKRQSVLVIALTILTAGALDTLFLVMRKALNPAGILILGIAFLLCYFYAVPPISYAKKGYAELSEAILVPNLIPGLAFLIGNPSLHVLLAMLTFPLTLLYLALKIVWSLESYAFDRTHANQTLVVRMDWQKATVSHNFLILAAFLLVGVFLLIGLPWGLTWPMLLPLFLGIFQIMQIQAIVGGVKPKWKLLKWTAAGTFAVTAYLVSFTLWVT
jgi:1,4-dihydroxy-2-naphthoate octaprenyltransferase